MQNQAQAGHIEPGTVIDGRYRVVRAIAEGRRSVVHEVEHVLTGRRLALKSALEPSASDRLKQQARAASLLKNPHAVRVTDMGRTAALGPYLVMDLLEGPSLRALLERTGKLPLETVADVALQAGECLAEAHAAGFWHGRLRPEAVLLLPGARPGSYEVKLLGFGAPPAGAEPAAQDAQPDASTAPYESLEQLQRAPDVDRRADVYALSALLYECLAGTLPFEAKTRSELALAMRTGQLPAPLARLRPELPADIGDVVMRGLTASRERRLPGVAALAAPFVGHADPSHAAWLDAASSRRAPAPPLSSGFLPVDRTIAFAPSGPDSPLSSRPRLGAPRAPAVPVFGRREPLEDDDALTVIRSYEASASAAEPLEAPDTLPELVREKAASRPLAGGRPPAELDFDDTPRSPRVTPTTMLVGAFEVQSGEPEPAGSLEVAFELDRPEPAPRRALPPAPEPAPLPPAPVGTVRLGQSDLDALRAEGAQQAASLRGASGPPSFGAPPAPLAATAPPPPLAAAPEPLPAPRRAPRPTPEWQRALDARLHVIGAPVDDVLESLGDAFRAASPRQQLLLSLIAAGIVGVLLVVLLFMNLSR